MKQIRVQRKPRRHGGGADPVAALPTRPVSSTQVASDIVARIDRMLNGS